MQENVVVYRIFIAGPGDVKKERDAACREVLRWNAAHSLQSGVIIEAVSDAMHAEFMEGGHPQNLINDQLLERCDFLLAVFGSRLGTPTESDLSGTVQEIREFAEDHTKDRVMIFFSKKKHPNDVDSDQLAALRKFKKETEPHGLQGHFKSTPDFSDQFRHQLEIKMARILQKISQKRIKAGTTPPIESDRKEQPIFRIDFSSLIELSNVDDSWTIGMPSKDQPKQNLERGVPESPNGIAVSLNMGNNTIAYQMSQCLNVKRVEFVGLFQEGCGTYVKLRLSRSGKEVNSKNFFRVCGVDAERIPQVGYRKSLFWEWDVWAAAIPVGVRGWQRLIVNIDDLFAKSFATEGFSLVGVEGVNLRGKMTLATIEMYGPAV